MKKKTKNIKEIGEDIGNVAKTTIDATKNAIKKQRIDFNNLNHENNNNIFINII